MLKKILVCGLLFLLTAGCGNFDTKKQADNFKIYSDLPPALTQALIDDFKRNNQVRQLPEIVLLPTREFRGDDGTQRAALADFWLGGTAEDYYRADSFGLLFSYRAPELKNIPLGLRDKNDNWTGLYTTNLVFVYNKSRLKQLGLERPRQWQDLLEEGWQNEIVLSAPERKEGGYRSITTLWQLYGETSLERYLTSLLKQKVEYTDSDDEALAKVNKGEKALTVVTLELAMPVAVEGSDLLIDVPDDGTSRKVFGAALLAGSSQQEVGRAFMDYLVSERAKIILDNSAYYVWPLTDAVGAYTWGKPYSDAFLVQDDLRWCVLSSNDIIDKFKAAQQNVSRRTQ